MSDPGTPLQTLEHGKRLIDLVLELEPNTRIRAAIAEQLAEHARIRAIQLKESAALRPSGMLPAVEGGTRGNHPDRER